MEKSILRITLQQTELLQAYVCTSDIFFYFLLPFPQTTQAYWDAYSALQRDPSHVEASQLKGQLEDKAQTCKNQVSQMIRGYLSGNLRGYPQACNGELQTVPTDKHV